ncbi:MAG TPA: hypothetical protein VLS96_07210 [Nodosilinea sp.]|nr:hypothetical protein [Nodosilinea sp.]
MLPSQRATLLPVPSGNAPAQSGNPDNTPSPGSSAAKPDPDSADNPDADDLAIQPGEGQSGGDNPAVDPNAADPAEAPATQDSDLLARVEYSDAQTNDADVEIAKAAWLQAVETKLGTGLAEAPEPITLKVPYSGRLCLDPEPEDGLLGLVGLPEEDSGELALWVTVLKSTGYAFLNEAAEQALKDLEKQASSAEEGLAPDTLYQVIVDIEYDAEACLSREALLQSRTAEAEEPSADDAGAAEPGGSAE